ncbi:ribose transport system ATP-binding protein [Paenarthrobacter nitroguajacolicus]|uniref:sugar ABC transporter ATP-binding protein n=1 Tax=Paenarthrobacter nitroguajacolicus TaxID=211146 RepID=UPI00286003F9|nr:sugar ABC transporter ATP-binding protein [Paenarthrobacter nitroguajacolicus]MDR6986947.1 ribose transport system ATP-binding protein [Paenarthrobacter nitroguajacolicus]
MNTPDNVIEMRSISKGFNGVSVLKDVSFDVRRGEVHALAGGNGAGKSTLMKILQGVYQADAGEILVGGKTASIHSIQDAKDAGIGMVFQEFSLVPSLTVAQNIFLAAEPLGAGGLIDDRAAARRAKEVFSEMEVDVDPRAEVSRLGTAYWQLTEIAKALAQNATVLIMDEPTASLARHESEALFELIDRLKQRGISIIYISHRMDEVYRLADRITILRDGSHLLTEPLTNITREQIVEGIVGKKIEGQLTYQARSHIAHDEAPLLEVRGLNAGHRVRDVSFALQPGEILGLAGLMGSGRTELARALFGIDRVDSGDVLLRGRKVGLATPQQAINAGIALIPEDRRAQGLVLEHSVQDNLLLPLLGQIQRGPLLDSAKGKKLASSLIGRFAVKATHPRRPVRLLSGGNQQKVVIAKWLGTDPDILILDEPTAGVDIGTKSEILGMIRELASAGKAVIVISSEYPELLAVSDRVLVLKDGSIIRDIPRGEIADEEYLQLAVQGV